MTKSELVIKLKALSKASFTEEDGLCPVQESHENADQVLLDFIDDQEVQNAFDSINKWYA